MAKVVIERARFLAWVRGAEDAVLAKAIFNGPVLLTKAGHPCSIAFQRDNGTRIEKAL